MKPITLFPSSNQHRGKLRAYPFTESNPRKVKDDGRATRAHWDISWHAPARRDKKGGDYATYVPDDLATRPVVIDRELARMAARVETAVRGMADAPTMRLLPLLPEAPVTTPSSAQRLLEVSAPAARAALEELAEVGILSRKKVDRGTTAYLARDVFDLLTLTERRLASTRWDTRESAPRRPSPARPQSY